MFKNLTFAFFFNDILLGMVFLQLKKHTLTEIVVHSHIIRNSRRYTVRVRVCGERHEKNLVRMGYRVSVHVSS